MLKKHKIPVAQSGQFSRLFIDYVNGEKGLDDLYSFAPNIASFAQAMDAQKKQGTNRSVLVNALKSQYASYSDSKAVFANIERLKTANTFTVCTGHQLCLFTGPLYFIYKIISTINLAEVLKKNYPENDFVPVYWMATEDHDFEEVSSINVFGKKLKWQHEHTKGAVGRLKTDSIQIVIDELKRILGDSDNAKILVQLFSDAYLKQENMADATRYLVHQLFSEYGLLILDADDATLKAEFLTIIKDDISNQTNYKIVSESIRKLKDLGYEAQVNPREINVFRLNEDRVRIEKASPEVLNLKPEEYSPNVVLRPLYQQMILPNLAYVGGPGELAYWLEYKAMFDHHNILFPVLMPRNFAVLTDEKTEQQIIKLGFETKDMFRDTEVLIKDFVTRNAGAELSLSAEEEKLRIVYEAISQKATAVDPTLKASVEGELQKALNALKNIESKLTRSEKQKQETSINQIRKIKDKFFPEGTLQERYENFSPYYLKSGKQFISDLKNTFVPFEFDIVIAEI